jgi:hypothetical protein
LVEDGLAHIVVGFLWFGTLDGVQILSPESIEQMHTRDVVLSGTDIPSMQLYGIGWG